MKGKEEKIGFGSSAAASVAITAAALKLHGIGIETQGAKEKLFKLAIIAHYKAQGKIGSGFDVAASTFGGALHYKRFDSAWLENELAKKPLIEVVEEKWPGLETKNIELPKNMVVLIGYTGKSASTTELVKKVREFKKISPEKYDQIIAGISRVTQDLEDALAQKKETEILAMIEANRKLLSELSQESGAGLEIEAHRKMSQIAAKNGAIAKFSGAGGGDCSICVTFSEKIAKKIARGWEQNGYKIVDAKISSEGAKTK
ncbi:MAG: phosphomevalonate kinase [archaeon]|nr:phosphomevalonate kinase [archaeon]